MCLTTTHNTVFNALVVPQELRHKVLIAARDGLGHGRVNATCSLINKHFTWPKISETTPLLVPNAKSSPSPITSKSHLLKLKSFQREVIR